MKFALLLALGLFASAATAARENKYNNELVQAPSGFELACSASIKARCADPIPRRAKAIFVNKAGDKVTGYALFEQQQGADQAVKIQGQTFGLQSTTENAVIIHTGTDCDSSFGSIGAHYTKSGLSHKLFGASDAHLGDLKDIAGGGAGAIGEFAIADSKITLEAGQDNTIAGKVIVIYAEANTAGSGKPDPTTAVACGVITAVTEDKSFVEVA